MTQSNEMYNVAILGATGAVGQQMMDTLDRLNFPVDELKLLSSKRSAGKKISFKGKELTVEEAKPESFEGIDLALFSAGGSISKELAPEAVKRGAVVVDNTSAFRMTEGIPLVVPEVNSDALKNHKGIIANPNCSTIQMVAAMEPIRKQFGLKRVIVSTYQAVSGAGNAAVDEMYEQTQQIMNDEPIDPQILPVGGDKKHYQIAFNAVPQIDVFQSNGYTFEEMKMINETKKIMSDESIQVVATCVRIPVETGHSESVYIEVEKEGLTVDTFKNIMKDADGVTLQDDPTQQIYPLATDAQGKDDVFVGRIRQDLDHPKGFHFWVVSDNLLKGAALNSVQIAQSLVEQGLLKK
ncbi:aspartate-semialdehyde dehydrogenase [Salisediminibacterium beveridgei]|uniref:Aspartate-semialdehyde dehydrogenase n=1 Tax=Salisediminibacterium beveridgei TaxID=632773 RepID=A0A1D7QVV2_9BACI|nr:aspartate-semialdehyde dehydrogenase [Salisediminibacterium beveridgei]AOM83135.1 Aspartate-semialdehyde dehydrogenase [Salisediminibacterium beveridgei]